MTVPHVHTGYERNSELDMAGRFVPIMDLRQDDDNGNSHTSDIPLQLFAGANVASVNSASVFDTVSDRGTSLTLIVSPYVPSGFTSSSVPSGKCSSGYTTSTRSFECSARNGSTCSASSTKRTSRNLRQLRGKSCQCFGKK